MEVLETVHSDLMGPEEVASAGGARYIMNLVDDYLSMTWIYLHKEKSQAQQAFAEWQALTENKTGKGINRLRTDGGGKYTSSQFEWYLHEHGIEHQLTAPHTSAQNG